MRRVVIVLAAALVALTADRASAAGPLHRYALVVGANYGGADRPTLRYAISDAERFAHVMVELGGVSPGDEVVLRQPKLRDLMAAFDSLSTRVVEGRSAAKSAQAGRIELVLYYSGHADEKGLLLGDDRYSYRALRDRLDQIPADVRIAVLDACASGAFTRVKGGRARPAFLVDESADMRGHAFLTSSAETEAAQESDRIRASYFTYFLVSGFRGAADLSGDGKITLSEAYQFAFNETLGRTQDTKGGPQHPSYDINMSGTGDVVMTDVRQTSATLVLGEELEGRFFVRNASQELVVELYKPLGRRIALGVEPGAYEVRIERDKGSWLAKTDVADGASVVLEPRQFSATTAERTRLRGGPQTPSFAVAGRNRLELRLGMWRTGGSNANARAASVSSSDSAGDLLGGLQYTRYLNERLAMTFALEGFGAQSGVSIGPNGIFSGDVALLALPVGIRWNPLRGEHHDQAMKPFLAFAAGPVFGASDGSFVGGRAVTTGSHVLATLGTRFGGGVDIHVLRSFTIGVDVGYNWLADFSQPVGPQKNYSGFGAGVGFGWLFGKGAAWRP